MSFVLGAALALAGVGVVEALVALGSRPLGPVGWPGLGVVLAGAIAGVPGAVGGALIVAGYFALNAGYPERFPHFFANPWIATSWVAVLVAFTLVVIALRERRNHERVLSESETRFRSLTELGSDFYWEQDEQYRFVRRVGSTFEKQGYPESLVLGKTRWELPALNMTQGDWARHRADLDARREFRNLVIQRPGPGGTVRYVSTSGQPIFDASGRFTGYRGIGRDVTAQRLAEQALQESERRLRLAAERLELALEGSHVALWDTDLATGMAYLSEAWAALIGDPPGETRASLAELVKLVHPEDLEAVRAASVATLKGLQPSYAVEHRVRTRTGEWKWILSRGKVAERSPAGRALRLIGTNVDITERKRAEEAVHREARLDTLTRVANRVLFYERISRAVARSRRHASLLALVYLDIDHFKPVNDSFGHLAGDALLKEVAARLQACVRATDTVARMGGDEFVLLLEDLKDPDDAVQLAEKIQAAMHEPLEYEGRRLAIGLSMGISISSCGDTSPEELLKRADAALYKAKAAGRGQYHVANA